MELTNNAIIDLDYYAIMQGIAEVDSADENKVITTINYVSMMFEKFCNRVLIARDFDYDPDSEDYDEKYSIFEGKEGTDFYLPTYPINSVTTFIIDDETISAATTPDDLDGYHVSNSRGKITYYGGLYTYYRSIKIKWNGGYGANAPELEELKFLCYSMVDTLLNSTNNPNIQSEKIGNYSYTNHSPQMLLNMSGMNPAVFAGLKRYRKEVI
jgi:hypothetical protein